MKKITKVYTRRGDEGQTSLVGGQRVSKASVRLSRMAPSTNSVPIWGCWLPCCRKDMTRSWLKVCRTTCLMSVPIFATDQDETPLYSPAYLPKGAIEQLEQEVDAIMELLPEKQGFILPSGVAEAAQAHVCRTVCRRAERRIVELSATATVSPEVLQYVNRLSDYLFVLAKKLNFIAGHSEKLWQNACK